MLEECRDFWEVGTIFFVCVHSRDLFLYCRYTLREVPFVLTAQSQRRATKRGSVWFREREREEVEEEENPQGFRLMTSASTCSATLSRATARPNVAVIDTPWNRTRSLHFADKWVSGACQYVSKYMHFLSVQVDAFIACSRGFPFPLFFFHETLYHIYVYNATHWRWAGFLLSKICKVNWYYNGHRTSIIPHWSWAH